MTKSQSEVLATSVKGWERINGKITVLGYDEGVVVCQLETKGFTQKFTIGKRGAVEWKYRYNKL